MLEQFLSPPIPYELLNGPLIVPDKATALRIGANCFALFRLAQTTLGIVDDLPLAGLYEATMKMHLVPVDTEDLEVGDGILFGPENPEIGILEFQPVYDDNHHLTNWMSFPIRHIGMVAAIGSEDGPQILHASQYDGRSAVWPLGAFREYSRYAKQFGRHRPAA